MKRILKKSGKFLKIMPLAMLMLVLVLLAGCGTGKTSVSESAKSAVAVTTEAETVSKKVTASKEKDTSSKQAQDSEKKNEENDDGDIQVSEDGEYSTKEEVALYIHLYGHLPDNFITKKEAKELGWVSTKGNLREVAPGKSIGGDSFGNREGLLPSAKGRKYYECDIDYEGGTRGAKRIIYSNDGLVFYTEDHYESFEQLY